MNIYISHCSIIIIIIINETASLLKVDYVRKNATSQSNTISSADSSLAIDKKVETCSISASGINSNEDPWWKGELDGVYKVIEVTFGANNSDAAGNLSQIDVYISRNGQISLQTFCSHVPEYRNVGSELFAVAKCKEPLIGKYVSIKKSGRSTRIVMLCEVNVYADIDTVSLAYNRPTFQSGTLFNEMSNLAVDGYKGTCGKVKADGDDFGWWRVALERTFYISGVNILFKPNTPGALTFGYFNVFVSNDDTNFEQHLCATFTTPTNEEVKSGSVDLLCKQDPPSMIVKHNKAMQGKYVTIKKYGGRRPQWLILCEVQVFIGPWPSDCEPEEHKCEVLSSCLSSNKKCDRIKQCPDGSDELNCSCPSDEYKCKEGHCISNDWLCDGTKDCALGDDEEAECGCEEGNFKCKRYKMCIDNADRCDGEIECPDFSDEDGCFTLKDNFLMSKFRGEMFLYMCSRNWLPEFSALVCAQHFQSFLEKSYTGKISSSPSRILLLLSENNDKYEIPGIKSFTHSPTSFCVPEEYIKIECLDQNLTEYTGFCGTRGRPYKEVGPYIINGNVASEGAWPWHVQLIVNKLYKCGGSILDKEWVLTSAACVDGVSRVSEIFIKVGTNFKNDPRVDLLPVSQIIMHPNYEASNIVKNLALIKTEAPIKFTHLVRPICLPTNKLDSKTLSSYRHCVASGFGDVDRDRTESMFLLQGRINLIPTNECSQMLEDINYRSVSKILKTNEFLCGGVVFSEFGINLCVGDNGSPLVCKREDGAWIQVGVVASVDFTGIEKCSSNLFTRIDNDVDLIYSVINPQPKSDSPTHGTASRNIEATLTSLMTLYNTAHVLYMFC